MTVIGPWFWTPMDATDAALMAVLCVSGMVGHFLLIKTYEVAEASAVQPFAYLQIVFAIGVGMLVFGETLAPNVALGGAVVAMAGLFALLRERQARSDGA